MSARKRIQPRRVTRVGTLLGAFLLAAVGIVVPAGPAQAISVPNYRYLCDREPPDVHHVIELIFHTGNDDLRGNNFQGDNNLDIAIVTDHQPSGILTVANQGDNWPNNSRRVIHICVTNFGITPDNLSGVRLTTTGGGGPFADGWNLNAIEVNYQTWTQARGQQQPPALHHAEGGYPLVRLTPANRTFDVHVNPVFDGGFEAQTNGAVGSPWVPEGPDWKGIDVNNNVALTGRNNGFAWSTGTNWNALLQLVPVTPNTEYVLTGWVQTSPNINVGYFGARLAGVWPPPGEAHFGYTGGGYQLQTVRFNSTNHTSATVFCGLWGTWTPAGDWVRCDNIRLMRA